MQKIFFLKQNSINNSRINKKTKNYNNYNKYVHHEIFFFKWLKCPSFVKKKKNTLQNTDYTGMIQI